MIIMGTVKLIDILKIINRDNSIIIKGFHSNLIIIAKTQQKIAPYHKKVSIGIGTGYEV